MRRETQIATPKNRNRRSRAKTISFRISNEFSCAINYASSVSRELPLLSCECLPASIGELFNLRQKLWKMVGEWERRRSKDSRCANAKQSIIIHHLQKRRFAREKNYAFKRLRQNTNNYHHTSLFAGGLDARERLIGSRSFIHNRFRWWTHLSYTTRCTICRFPGAF